METTSTEKKLVTTGGTIETDRYDDPTASRRTRVFRAVCRVTRPMNSHGALTVESATGHRAFHVVEYATPGIRAAMARLRGGTVVRVSLVALAARGDSWRAVGVDVRPSDAPPASSLSENRDE